MEIRANGALVHDSVVVGNVEEHPDNSAKITLDLGWLKAAGVSLVVRGESGRDARRVILDR